MKNTLSVCFSFALLLTGYMAYPARENLPGFWWVMGIALVVLVLNLKKFSKHIATHWKKNDEIKGG